MVFIPLPSILVFCGELMFKIEKRCKQLWFYLSAFLPSYLSSAPFFIFLNRKYSNCIIVSMLNEHWCPFLPFNGFDFNSSCYVCGLGYFI